MFGSNMETLGRRILLSILYSARGKRGERGLGRTRKRPAADKSARPPLGRSVWRLQVFSSSSATMIGYRKTKVLSVLDILKTRCQQLHWPSWAQS
jgi:hypothetical protein